VEFVGAQPQSVLHTAAHAVDQHIGGVDQRERALPTLIGSQVEHDPVLAPVPHREARHPPRPVAARRLDLHDVRAVVGEELTDQRPGHALAQLDHKEACERGAVHGAGH